MNKNLIIIFIIIAIIAILGIIFLFPNKEKPAAIQTVKEFPSNSDITRPQATVSKQENDASQPASIPGISPYIEQIIESGDFEEIVSRLNLDRRISFAIINSI